MKAIATIVIKKEVDIPDSEIELYSDHGMPAYELSLKAYYKYIGENSKLLNGKGKVTKLETKFGDVIARG